MRKTREPRNSHDRRGLSFWPAAICLGCLLLPMRAAGGADWPTFRRDNLRSGISDENLALPLVQAWVFRTPFPPEPAFGHGLYYGTNGGGGRVERRRIDFDRADSTVIAGGRVFFGSVGDGMIRCLDAETGGTVWSFATGGPVRLAPAAWEGRVYAGSDDGWVYCLAAADGKVVWKLRAAPDDHRVIGDGRLISLWPVRTGVMIDQGVAYFAAGIFPSEGVFLYAVDARTGRVLWKNDWECERPLSKFAPLGYLLTKGERLLVPQGRLSPAVFDRRTGNWLANVIGRGGGSFATIRGDYLYACWEGTMRFPISGPLPDPSSDWGTLYPAWCNLGVAMPFGGQIVVDDRMAFSCGVGDKQNSEAPSAKFQTFRLPPFLGGTGNAKDQAKPRTDPELAWERPMDGPESVIIADAGPDKQTVLVGAKNRVAAFNAADGKEVWGAAVDGSALSLSLSQGRLLVSTDKGRIYCFAPQGTKARGDVSAPLQTPVVSAAMRQAAERILKLAPESGKGFALIYGVETGELALELARRTELKIYGVSPDAQKVATARRLLESAGLWGGRVVIEQWPLEKVPCTKYFANLVVSETAILTGKMPGAAAEVHRMTAPVRGTVVLVAPKEQAEFTADALKTWAGDCPMAAAQIEEGGACAVFRRPPLAGARPWTHDSAGPGRTSSSEDREVRGPLRVQWFGRPGPEVGPNRHMCASAPLASEGRMLFCSERDVAAYDVYNGTRLWSHPLTGAWRPDAWLLGSNAAVGPEGYFVVVGDTCHRLDPATGKTLGEYKIPPPPDGKARLWGILLLHDGVLIGSRTIGHVALENQKWTHSAVPGYWKEARRSDLLFGMDAKTGKVLWTFAPSWFHHGNVVADGGRVFLTWIGGTPDEERQAVAEIQPFIARLAPAAQEVVNKAFVDRFSEKQARFIAKLAALDVKTGNPQWQRPVDWTPCGGQHVHGSARPPNWMPGMLIAKNGVLLQMTMADGMSGSTPIGHYPGRCAAARDAATGRLLWLESVSNASRPIVIGDTIYAEPVAFDLKTGKPKMIAHPISGKPVPYVVRRPYKHCGPAMASACLIFGRSEGMGYVDLARDEGTTHFPCRRPNCGNGAIAGEGLALWPVTDAGCQCGLPFQCSLALVHEETPRQFAVYSQASVTTPVKQLALNLAAPGDLRDSSGRLWLAMPRPIEPLFKYEGIKLPVEATFYEGGCCVRRHSFWTPIADTDTPWVYTSAAAGLRRLTISAREAADGPAAYTVRLHLAAPEGDQPGGRVFDVQIQGSVVRKGLDIVKEAGKAQRALVLEFKKVPVKDKLTVELLSAQEKPTPQTWPMLSGVELLVEP